MNKKLYISAVLFLVVTSLSAYALIREKEANQPASSVQEENAAKSETPNSKNSEASNPENAADSKIILYYSHSCPHCRNVEEYIEKNGIKEKISFVEKEVGQNRKNANEMFDKASACNIQSKSVGIPFLWDGENGDKCLMGDVDIIKYFETKINTK